MANRPKSVAGRSESRVRANSGDPLRKSMISRDLSHPNGRAGLAEKAVVPPRRVTGMAALFVGDRIPTRANRIGVFCRNACARVECVKVICRPKVSHDGNKKSGRCRSRPLRRDATRLAKSRPSRPRCPHPGVGVVPAPRLGRGFERVGRSGPARQPRADYSPRPRFLDPRPARFPARVSRFSLAHLNSSATPTRFARRRFDPDRSPTLGRTISNRERREAEMPKPAAGGLRNRCGRVSRQVRGTVAAFRMAFWRRASLRRRASHGFS